LDEKDLECYIELLEKSLALKSYLT